jgi:2-keto-4-pentenoate hydratase/2-oxohepta-3-ene-1,7-dioic acid hydratase in catechol pathway
MRLVIYNGAKLGVLRGDTVIDITDLVEAGPSWPPTFFVRAVAEFDRLRPAIEARLASPGRPLVSVKLESPVVFPSKLIAAPVNYRAHIDEAQSWEWMKEEIHGIDKYGVFLKAPSSIIGPNDVIELPPLDRRFDHEVELAFVIGKRARQVSEADAMDYVFGYTGAMDITLRGTEDRSTRKSFDTFTPVGPVLVTRDEIADPHTLGLQLFVNGQLRQDANTRDLIWKIPKLVSYASHVMTLYPGDLFITGTPEGVGPIVPDDRVTLRIDQIGEMTIGVAARVAHFPFAGQTTP